MIMRPYLAAVVLLGVGALRLSAQDTTQAYPWRLSYFPYITASPNDGVMAMGRVLFFQQSRWDDRVSLHSGVAIEGGYSTKNSWLLRARGDFPQLAPGWRLQVIGQANKQPNFTIDRITPESATQQRGSIEVTHTIAGPIAVALRGEASHLRRSFSVSDIEGNPFGSIAVSSTDVRGRIAIVVDQRDREYDTRSGTLLQGGYFRGHVSNYTQPSYDGVYGLAAGWLPLNEKTRVTARVGARFSDQLAPDAARVIPAWEDDILIAGGPESNRALPIAARVNNCVKLASAELRHDVKVFPGGAITLLAFVDGSQADNCNRDHVTVALRTATSGNILSDEWAWGPGAGVSLRLLRNAILTATIARGDGASRIYVSSGWSW